ncbi:hypothetical protein K9N68_11795 [Kovacikia minuta CCNUW1]|uniref:hypothetical protein n=1 Tax=Kovacikia minuta TaxID=2931930 RepID=UPI001CC8F463|nr:hypothetical protein [Kovacikia minuta]UBF28491.1 hypothetical protein K9N68_11795 [Kovacikia minuta CCNUW1]
MGLITGILSALIAAVVSLVVALISYISNRNALKSQREKLDRELQRSMTTKLYDKRLEIYPEAIQITEGLRKSRMEIQGKDISEAYFREIVVKLDEWHNTKAFLLLSEDSVQAFYALRRVTREKPELEGKYSKEHLERIWHAKNAFRYALRSDIQLLYREEI